MTDQIQKKLSQLPLTPGVYIFFGLDQRVLYIGKAIKLRNRVRSYFRENASLEPAKHAMVREIADIKIHQCDSEIEALILEAKLIKKYQTKYNILLRDDKSYSYVAITKEEFPRLYTIHKKDQIKDSPTVNYLGPFVNAEALAQTMKILRKIFPYRSCLKLPKKPCIYYRLKRCNAPCVGFIQKEQYMGNIKKIISFLKGNKQHVLKELRAEMQVCSERLDYERAAVKRNQIYSLEKVLLHKKVITESKNRMVSALTDLQEILKLDVLPKRIEGFDSSHFHGTNVGVSMVVFENGKPQKDQYRLFKIRNAPQGGDDFYNLRQALRRRFRHKEWKTPQLILIDGGKGQLSSALIAQARSSIEYQNIPIISLAKRQEEVYLPNQSEPIFIPEGSKALRVLQQIRDESHRFAITYHRKMRSKELLKK